MNNEKGKIYYGIGLDNAQLRADANESRNIIRGVGDTTSAEGTRIDNTFQKIGGAITAAFSVAAVSAFMKNIVQVRGEIEALEISFKTLAGETEGTALFSEIRKFAVETPMMMQDLAKGAQMLLSFNVPAEQVMTILKQIGDISMGNADKFNGLTLAFSQMSSMGKLMGQDLLQMINAGFNPLSVISEKTGKSVAVLKDEMAKGAISSEMVAEAFATATSAGGKFFGMLESQSKGINGSISNLKGAIEDALNDIGTKNQDIITGVISSATNVVKNYKKIGEALAALISIYGSYKAAVIACNVVESIRYQATLAQMAGYTKLGAIMEVLKAKQELLNKAILKNPYALAAAAVVALGYGMYKLATYQSDAEKAQKKLNDAIEDSDKSLQSELYQINLMFSRLKAAKEGTEEYKDAKQAIINQYGEYLNKLGDEKAALNDIAAAYTLITEEATKAANARAIQSVTEEAGNIVSEKQSDVYDNVKKLLTKKFKGQKSPDGIDLADEYLIKLRPVIMSDAEITSEVKDIISQFDKTKYIAGDPMNNVGSYTYTDNKLQEQLSSLAKVKATAERTVKEATEKFGESTATIENNSEDALDEATDSSQAPKAKEELIALKKAEQDINDLKQKATKDLYDEELSLKRKQITDKVKLIEFDRDVAIAAIEAEKQAYLQLAAISGTDKNNIDSSMYDNRISAVKVSAKIDIDKANIEDADEVKAQLEALKQEFETYEQERTRIQADYAAKRKLMYEDDGETLKNGFNQGNVDELDRLQTEALNVVDTEIANREASFNNWVSTLINLGLTQLKEALQTARQTLENGGANLSDKEKATLRAQIAALEKQIDVENAKSPEQRAAEKSKKQWGDTLKMMNNVQETVKNITDSFDGLDEATKQALSAATNIAGGIIGMISGIQSLAIKGAEAIKGVERASVILAIIGTAVQILTSIFNMAGAAERRHQEALEEISRNKLATQREYNKLLFEQNLLLKEATSIFGVDEIAKAINAFEQYREQLSKYRDELKGTMPVMNLFERMTNDMLGSFNKRLNDYKSGIGALSEIVIKTGHERTGLFGWGKGRDIYTSILEVYPDIIDKEGQLNVERAKAILSTQTMSDENKALLQSLVDLQENAEKAMEELNGYLENTFGELGGSIMDAITDGITNGTDAWKEFGKTGASVLEKLGKQIAYELFFSEKFKNLQKQLTNIYGSGNSPEQVAKDARNAVSDFYNGIGNDMQNAENWLEQWKAEATEKGLNLWSDTQREASNKGIATASQESVDENNGRLTAIQGHTFSIVESTKQLVANSALILDVVMGIKDDTTHLKRLDNIESDMQEVKNTVNDIALKGIKLK